MTSHQSPVRLINECLVFEYQEKRKSAKMPACVIVKNTKKILVLKSAWCDYIKNNAENVNTGVPSWSTTKIFFSPDKKQVADFQLETTPQFDENQTGCYEGYILRVFGNI